MKFKVKLEKFILDATGVANAVDSDDVAGIVTEYAESASVVAQSSAPVTTGDYAGSIVASPARRGPEGPEATFGSNDPFWHLIEFGSINNAPHRTLSNAARSVGLDYEDT